MTLVRIVMRWARDDLLRQTPESTGVWEGVRFTLDPVDTCDYLVVLSGVQEPVSVRCHPHNVWTVVQEPPNEIFQRLHRGIEGIHRVYTTDPSLRGRKYVHSQPALQWLIDRNYDELVTMPVPPKDRSLSWITSNLAVFEGHRTRMQFLNRVRDAMSFDLFGRGFNFIEDKWDGLAPYRYTIAVENYQNPYYWSEKITDPLLAWTMPIYFGCTRISKYLPEGSFVAIDINDPDAIEQIQEIVASDLWHRNLDAIAEARRRILQEYQLFPFLAREIHQHPLRKEGTAHFQPFVTVTDRPVLADRIRNGLRSMLGRYVSRHLHSARAAMMRRITR
jgi:Glycosyltransferase family 10 (fucosyltransferase) C-term